MTINTIKVYTPDVLIENADVEYNETIEQISSVKTLKTDDVALVPGFVDTHNHGCMGEDFSDTDFDGLTKMENFLYSRGVTTVLATTLSLPFERIKKVVSLIRDYREKNPKTSIAGIKKVFHLLQPF